MKKLITLILLSFAAMLTAGAQQSKGKFIVVIDAGHGGKDPGAVNGKYYEKTINLNVALELGHLIEEECSNVQVIYTRKTDVFVELYKRADIANKAKANLFISIHTNSSSSKAAYGAETYLLGVEANRTSANLNAALAENNAVIYEDDYETHYEGYDPKSPESMIIFEFLQNEYQSESQKMAIMVQDQMTGYGNRHDRGVHQAGYLVLWKNAMPSILIELGFISNNDECRYLYSTEGQHKLAESIKRAFVKYLNEYTQSAPQHDKSVTKPTTAKQTPAQPDAVDAAVSGKPAEDQIVYRIQFMASTAQLKENDKRLAGLEKIWTYKEGSLIKYTCCGDTDLEKVKACLTQVKKKYPDAFIVKFKDGVKLK